MLGALGAASPDGPVPPGTAKPLADFPPRPMQPRTGRRLLIFRHGREGQGNRFQIEPGVCRNEVPSSLVTIPDRAGWKDDRSQNGGFTNLRDLTDARLRRETGSGGRK